MNILFTNNQPMNPHYGGIERVTDVLAKALVRAGHAVYYYTFSTPSPALLDYEFPAELHLLPYPRIDDSRNRTTYLQFLREKGIELIINQRGLLPTANFFIEDLPSTIRVISVLHSKPFGYWDAYWHTLFANRYGLTNLAKCVLKSLAVPYLWCIGKRIEYKKIKDQLEHVAMLSDQVVVLDEQYKQLLCRRCEVDEQKVVVIPNPNTYTATEPTGKMKEVLYVGRLAAWDKNVMDIVKIWSKVEPLHPDWKCIVVGEGAQEKHIRHRIQRQGLAHIEMVGKQDPRRYYANAKIVMLASNYEGFPMSVTEGMQHGAVPVVMNTFCAQNMITDGVSGRIIAPHDINAFAEVLHQLMTHEEELQRMSGQARKEVEQFSQEKIVNQWFQLLSQYTM